MKPNEPRRLRDFDPNCRDLLDVAAAYRVAPAVRSRLLGRLVSDVAVTGAMTDVMTSSPAPTATTASTTATASVVPTTAKVWIAGFGLVIVGVATLIALTRFWPADLHQTALPSPSAAVPSSAPPMPASPVSSTLVPVASNPTAVAPPWGSFTTTTETTKPARRPTLADELLLLDRATAALRRSDDAGALAVLARYRRGFPHGALREEAEVIEIEALAASGRFDEAHAKAATFLRARPHGVFSAKVRAFDATTNR